MSLTITRLSGLALHQDLGRPGYASLGVSPSGAANRSALRAANTSIGNRAGAASLELIGMCELLPSADAVIALTGASARVEGAIPRTSHMPGCDIWQVRRGKPVTIVSRGLRTYLAVRGGFEVPLILGSASRDTLSGLGPSPLAEGDTLTVGTDLAPLTTIDPNNSHGAPVKAPGALLLASVYPGPRADWTSDLDVLFSREYRVSEHSDRVGTRLEGEGLRRIRSEELPSEGVVRGAVQLPPSGLPLIFGPDHPTTGGYPVIGVLAPAAIDALAHAAPGQAIRFRRAGLRSG